MRVKVKLNGCDDITEIPMDVTEDEYKFLRKLEKASKEISETICMPTLEVEHID